MTYGYRLNIEDIYIKSADEHWTIAKQEMKEISDEDPATSETRTFRSPTSDKGISSSVQAIVGWAICFESFINSAWNLSIANKMPSSNLNKELMKKLSTIEKMKEILRQNNIALNDKSWISDLTSLFQLRNRLVHFKDTIEYVGFSFAPEFAKDFEENKLNTYRKALNDAIVEVGNAVDLRTEFLHGTYEIQTYEE